MLLTKISGLLLLLRKRNSSWEGIFGVIATFQWFLNFCGRELLVFEYLMWMDRGLSVILKTFLRSGTE